MSISPHQAEVDGAGLAIGIVCSRFNQPVCEALREACVGELLRRGVSAERIKVCSVPGALEIPQVLRRMADSGVFDALIAIGAVIRGETYHFEIVCNEASRGIQQVSLDARIPVANAVLTTNTDEQAEVRAPIKGAEAAQVAIEMARLSSWLDGLTVRFGAASATSGTRGRS